MGCGANRKTILGNAQSRKSVVGIAKHNGNIPFENNMNCGLLVCCPFSQRPDYCDCFTTGERERRDNEEARRGKEKERTHVSEKEGTQAQDSPHTHTDTHMHTNTDTHGHT